MTDKNIDKYSGEIVSLDHVWKSLLANYEGLKIQLYVQILCRFEPYDCYN